jgi:hypothetical protein
MARNICSDLGNVMELANKATLFVNSITSSSKTARTSDGRIVEPNFVRDLFKRHTRMNLDDDDDVDSFVGNEDEEEEIDRVSNLDDDDDDDDDDVGSVVGIDDDDDDDDDVVVKRKRGGNGDIASDDSDSESSDDSSDYYDENDGDHLNEKAIWGKMKTTGGKRKHKKVKG